ncbi:DUF2382 domain-containing protein [Lysinibacillus yapensis]|uniref:DUF2382 domain-containing protein n=1 Tax=Ureibacillus yapensis TaxID=2304605 RepID=A0A396S3B3_9BACL|nr:YsnF/AvaK domain-containing protein [Lysinibacillus yapensis]RHW32428.1 DUF2382 domain-containing protein [Lysinibacillus yapensis]
MALRDNKLHGIYNSEAQLQAEMDRLRLQGYRDEDMFIVSHRDNQFTLHRGSTTNGEEIKEGSWWDKFKAFMSGEDTMDDNFRRIGFTDEERERYYSDLRAGKYLLYVDSDYDTYYNGTLANALTNNEETVELHEERLNVDKKPVVTGEVTVNKNVHEDEQVIEVPVEREEVYVERRPVNVESAVDGDTHFRADGTLNDGETIHIPVTEERVDVTKKDVVTEEVVVGKRKVMDTETVRDTVRREEVEIEGMPNIEHDDTFNNNENRY